MEGVKKIFGWLLMAMAAYFLKTVLPDPVGRWLLPAVLAIGAITLALGRAGWGRPARLSAAAVFLAAALFFLPRSGRSSSAVPWEPYSAAEISRARRPAVVDFSAEWCLPCRELDEKTFSDARVQKELSRRALFKADLTNTRSPEATSLSEKYEIFGVPTIIFLDAAGQERKDLRLVGFEEPEKFLQRLAQAP
jgi:thiol:disulfide interchange protein DsbD